jgi:molybdopterin converting factor subunit 1
MNEMEITVLLFASVADRLGTRRLSLQLDEPATVATARDALLDRYPQLSPFLPNLLYAVDEEYVRVGAPITAGATLALIPPVSGG